MDRTVTCIDMQRILRQHMRSEKTVIDTIWNIEYFSTLLSWYYIDIYPNFDLDR